MTWLKHEDSLKNSLKNFVKTSCEESSKRRWESWKKAQRERRSNSMEEEEEVESEELIITEK